MGRIIGIDLGTTNSCVATLDQSNPVIIPNSEGGRTTPSVVALDERGKPSLVGAAAKRQAVMHPENTISSIKRFMGRKLGEVSSEQRLVPYPLVENDKGLVQVGVGERALAPEQISAMVLQKLRADAEKFLGEPVAEAVITVPAYFNDSQRKATQDAGRVAGLEVLRIINEPTAAALAYGLNRLDTDQTILVFDLGGGTFDVSVLEVGDGVFEVRSTSGDNHLGGDDFDRVIVEWLAAEFKQVNGIDLLADPTARQRIIEASEKAKIELSSGPHSDISLPFIHSDESGPKHLEYRLTRAMLDDLCRDLVGRVEGPVTQALSDSGLTPDGIDHVILVGGMTRMPAVQDKVHKLLGKEPYHGVNPDEVVALGAAIQAGVITGDIKDLLLLDVTPLSLGIETRGGITTVLIERNTTIPTRITEIFTTAEDDQHSVEIHIVQGEREMASGNRTLARLQLLGIPPAPRGVPQIEVSFDIDANGVFSVSARDLGTGNEQHMQVQQENLSDDDIGRMVSEASEFADEDRARRELAEQRNTAESLLYHANTALVDFDERLDDELRERIEVAQGELREALASMPDHYPEREAELLKSMLHEVSERLYSGAGAIDYAPTVEPADIHEAEVTVASLREDDEMGIGALGTEVDDEEFDLEHEVDEQPDEQPHDEVGPAEPSPDVIAEVIEDAQVDADAAREPSQ